MLAIQKPVTVSMGRIHTGTGLPEEIDMPMTRLTEDITICRLIPICRVFPGRPGPIPEKPHI